MPTSEARLRRLSLVAGVVLLVEAAALAVVLLSAGRRVLLPVIAEFARQGGGASTDPGRYELAAIDLGAAAVVLCLIVGVARLIWLVPARSRHSVARWVEYSITSSVVVFLVAQLNGIVDVTTLVLIYAATSGMALFGMLQARVRVQHGHPKLALCFGAGLGIVPWGVIAFTQVGAGLVGDPPTAVVRVITLVMLGFAGAFAVTQWRERSTIDEDAASGATRTHVLLSLASTSVFAWLIVLGIVVPG